MSKTCPVLFDTGEKCSRKIQAKGMCALHYARKSKGIPLGKSIYFNRESVPCDIDWCDGTTSPSRYTKTTDGNYCGLHRARKRNGTNLHIPIKRKRHRVEIGGTMDRKGRGYLDIKVRPEDCFGQCNKNGWIAEHRYMMIKKLGRPLFPDENVHHINGNKKDNRIENLELWFVGQPAGQRVSDLLEQAKEFIERYDPEWKPSTSQKIDV